VTRSSSAIAARRAALAFLVAAAAATAGLALAPARSQAQDEPPPVALTGTLAKVRAAGAITLGVREASIPFSYRSPRGEVVGYSIDLCRLVVEAIGEAVGRTLAVRMRTVTPDTRIPALQQGDIDLECGSTTDNLERRKLVAFSPTIFVAGTRLLVRKGGPVASYRDLGGRRVVVTSGTTNEKAMRDLADRAGVPMILVAAPDHAAAFAQLAAGQVDAFATDDVLLHGFIAQRGLQAQYAVVGELLSYEPYALMYRKDDPQLARVVEDTFERLALDREIDRRYRQWFLQPLPQTEASLGLPMSAQLQAILQGMGERTPTE
jgi:glutamate/aspartate transport system substrate-binding protein